MAWTFIAMSLSAPCGSDAGLSKLAEDEAKKLVQAALAVAKDIVLANKQTHDGLSRELEQRERLEGPVLREWLSKVNPTPSLRHFVLQGVLPASSGPGSVQVVQ